MVPTRMCFSLPALLGLALSSAPIPGHETATAPSTVETPRALAAELGTAVGLFTGGYAFAGGRWEDAYLANTSSARFLLGGFTLDGGLLSLLPLERGGPGGSTTVTARLGYTGERWSVVGGAVVGLGYTARPLLQVLPSVKGLYRVGRVDLEAGIFDANGQVPAHLGASYGPVGLAYVFPLGARARVDIPLAARAGVRLEGFVFQYGDVRTSLVTVGIVGRPTASERAGGAS
ncbi:hypothetical protein [Pyxidicoccus sp. MSG2]|uniref:hypothetical protein n=1 Tax=Pyxidicoccus sp. MSG2 TaxID=2996790 RepID=UPI0022708CC6|nr:hypothetical protein [Pyxidicoccus sp. MSG2]MCY1018969.1 hypothetical protein [Pyxidicoccus sp. MSG2]